MIIEFKIFEGSKLKPIEDNEYVIVEPSKDRLSNWRTFFKSNIGQIICQIKTNHPYDIIEYTIRFKVKTIPHNGIGITTRSRYLWIFTSPEIISHSKNKKDLEYIIQANKYNL